MKKIDVTYRGAFFLGFTIFLIAALTCYFFLVKDRELDDRFQGRLCSVSPRILELGECAEECVSKGSFTLKNLTNRPITVFTAETSCVCATVESLPIVVSPGATVPLSVNILPPKGSSEYDQTVTYSVQCGEKIERYSVRITAIPRPVRSRSYSNDVKENEINEETSTSPQHNDQDLQNTFQTP